MQSSIKKSRSRAKEVDLIDNKRAFNRQTNDEKPIWNEYAVFGNKKPPRRANDRRETDVQRHRNSALDAGQNFRRYMNSLHWNTCLTVTSPSLLWFLSRKVQVLRLCHSRMELKEFILPETT